MEAIPSARKATPKFQGTTLWDLMGGGLVDELLEHTPLIDLEYIVNLVELGGVMPAGRQHVPPSALITKNNVWRLKLWGTRCNDKWCIGVLALSYPWLDWWHPDRLAAQLTRLLPVLKTMLAAAKKDSHCCTVGTMIDFLCLPQKPFRSDDEKLGFITSLKSINRWYYHNDIYTLLVTLPPPIGAAYSNMRLHNERGWCFFEEAACRVAKKSWCFLDLSRYAGAAEFGHPTKKDGGCIDQMKVGRKPPLSPIEFDKQMRERVESGELAFTANADMGFVIDQYAVGFVEQINVVAAHPQGHFRALNYVGCGWTDVEATTLLDALHYAAEKCVFPVGPIRVNLGPEMGIALSASMVKKLHGVDKFMISFGDV
jgi:hypothetical protein